MNLDSIYQAWRESGIDLLGGGDWNLFAAKLSERLAQPEQDQGPTDEQLTGYGYARGDYMSACHRCGAVSAGLDKHAMTCRPCAVDLRREHLYPSPDVALVRQLVDALRVGVRQNEHDMLMTGEELRASSSAIEAGQQWLKDRS